MTTRKQTLKKILKDLDSDSLSRFNTMLDKQLLQNFSDTKLDFFIPHPKQEDFISSPARIKAFIGGNRSGKTTAGAIDVILECIGAHPLQEAGLRRKPPVYWRVVCIDFLNGIEKIILPKIKEWMPKKYLIDGQWQKSWMERSKTLTLNNGSKIEFMSANQEREKFQGTSRDGLWIDEEIDKDIWQECRMRLIDRGGRSILTLTPINGMTWVYDDIYLKADCKETEVVTAQINENPHINPAEIEFIADGLNEEEKRVRLNGEFVCMHGLVYKEYHDTTPHVIDPFPIPPDWTRYIGIDPHLRTETAVVMLACNRDGDLFVYDEIFMDGLISEISQTLLLKMTDSDYFNVVIDPASKQPNPVSGVSIRDEFAKHGIIAKNAKKDVGVGIHRIRELLRLDPVYKKPKLFIFNTCRKLRYEFTHYIWDDDIHYRNRAVKQSPRKKNDHLLDCLRYIVMEDPIYISPAKKSYLRKNIISKCGY